MVDFGIRLYQCQSEQFTPGEVCFIHPIFRFWFLVVAFGNEYLVHVIDQPNLRIPNPQYLQRNFCFDFFNDSENRF